MTFYCLRYPIFGNTFRKRSTLRMKHS